LVHSREAILPERLQGNTQSSPRTRQVKSHTLHGFVVPAMSADSCCIVVAIVPTECGVGSYQMSAFLGKVICSHSRGVEIRTMVPLEKCRGQQDSREDTRHLCACTKSLATHTPDHSDPAAMADRLQSSLLVPNPMKIGRVNISYGYSIITMPVTVLTPYDVSLEECIIRSLDLGERRVHFYQILECAFCQLILALSMKRLQWTVGESRLTLFRTASIAATACRTRSFLSAVTVPEPL
jgi:hypothetical protein